MYIIQNSVSLQRVSAARDAEEQEIDDIWKLQEGQEQQEEHCRQHT